MIRSMPNCIRPICICRWPPIISRLNLPGFANWMRVQTQEEIVHATKFYDFMNERGGRVTACQSLDGPTTEWESPAAPFEQAYNHEVEVTRRIHNLVSMALDERDYATNTFLDWFVREQVEEESSTDAVVRQMKLVGDDRSALFLLDRNWPHASSSHLRQVARKADNPSVMSKATVQRRREAFVAQKRHLIASSSLDSR